MTDQPEEKPPRKAVAIVAMGASHLDYTSLTSQLGSHHRLVNEVWAINGMGGVIQHDLLFHMDDCKVQEARAAAKPGAYVDGMLTWLKDHPRFVTSKKYDNYPGAIEFPLQEVIDRFGHAYFNSTVAYAMAYAMHLEFNEIHLYGCDYSYDYNPHKVEKGRACLEFWIGVAACHGINVRLTARTTLMDSCAPLEEKLYGYDAYHLQLVNQDGKNAPQVVLTERDQLPTPEEIERRYGC